MPSTTDVSPSPLLRRSILLGLICFSIAGLCFEAMVWRTRRPQDSPLQIIASAAIWASIGLNMLGLLLRQRLVLQRILTSVAMALAVAAIVLLVMKWV